MIVNQEIFNIIKKYAIQIGFDDLGIVKADFLDSEKKYFLDWLDKGYNAEMGYMSRNIEKRLDPRLLVENAKSIIVVIKNYYPQNLQNTDTYKISKYAYNQDYHIVIKNDLTKLFEFINQNVTKIKGRIFVDSAPVLERAWAKKTGLGWIGKNSMLITKKGSFFFIGVIISDLETEYKPLEMDSYCGNCTKCIDACPTNAIVEPFVIDSNKCISYQTIENKGEIELNLKDKFNDFIFGCDICQDVCPWNTKQNPTNDKRFSLKDEIKILDKKTWEKLNKETFDNIFVNSAVKRTKFDKIVRNIKFVSNK